MASRGIASFNDPDRTPPKKASLPTPFVKRFRASIKAALKETDPASGKKLGQCIGVYIFFDYDGEPIYVGQTRESFGTRLGRHLTGQRTDAVAYGILDPFEVADVALYPAEHLRHDPDRNARLDALEYSVYLHAIRESRYGAILNEKIPPVSAEIKLPPSVRFSAVPDDLREEREHPDIRIARRAATLAHVAGVVHERGVVSEGLRRVIIVQAVRLADLAAARMAYAEGRSRPPQDAIDTLKLVGNVLVETADPDHSDDDPELDT